MLEFLTVAATIATAITAVYAGVKTVFNIREAYRNYKLDGSWEFTKAERNRKRQLRELESISESVKVPCCVRHGRYVSGR